jgi:hypothetical protein
MSDTLTQGKKILRYLKSHKGATIGDMARFRESIPVEARRGIARTRIRYSQHSYAAVG